MVLLEGSVGVREQAKRPENQGNEVEGNVI